MFCFLAAQTRYLPDKPNRLSAHDVPKAGLRPENAKTTKIGKQDSSINGPQKRAVKQSRHSFGPKNAAKSREL